MGSFDFFRKNEEHDLAASARSWREEAEILQAQLTSCRQELKAARELLEIISEHELFVEDVTPYIRGSWNFVCRYCKEKTFSEPYLTYPCSFTKHKETCIIKRIQLFLNKETQNARS